MGSKSVVNLRNRGVFFKCDICGLKLTTDEALDSHRRTAHNVITKRRKRPQEAIEPIKPVISPARDPLEGESEQENAPTETMQTTTSTKKKNQTVEFECPKCYKRFPTYFHALKHIEKYHSNETRTDGVPPNHPSRITPVRVELCRKCMCKVRSIHTHVCAGPKPGQVVCAACGEGFSTFNVFDFHVVTFHGGPMESMFFPTKQEFTKWKTEMEQQTKASYTLRDQYEIRNKRYYHCNRVAHNDQICPSTLVIQELSKGVQVHFYHQHYKHESIPYKLPPEYRKYSIMTFLKRAEDYSSLGHLQSDDDDLYMQFKTLMEGIIVDAAKINIQTLKVILGKALEITSILTNYDEEMDMTTIERNNSKYLNILPSSPKQALSDTEIVKALEEPMAKRITTETTITSTDTTTKTTNTTSNSEVNVLDVNLAKRKNNAVSTQEIKRPKTDLNENKDISPKIITAFSLADTKSKQKTVPEKIVVTKIETNKVNDIKETKSKTNSDDTPSTFSESYESFVVKNFPNTESVASRTRSKPLSRIEQFKPNIIKSNAKTKNEEKTKTINNNQSDDKTKTNTNINNKSDDKTKTNTITNNKTKSGNVNDAQIKGILKTSVVNKIDDKTKKVTIADEKTKATITKIDYNTRSGALTKTNETKTIVNNTDAKSKSLKVVQITKPVPKSVVEEKSLTRASKAQLSRISRGSLDKPKVDFEYEVKEQPDDCNILILKI